LAKGLGSGFPISAIGASAELMGRWPRGSHGGTYGGNPVGCAAALATLDVITDEGFLDGVVARGHQLATALAEMAQRDPGVAEVRALGLMVAVEFRQPGTGLPDTARVSAILGRCLTEGHLILMSAGTYSQAIRFMPPLVVSEAEIDEGLRAFEKALEATR
ncbi:MAG TPA: aminotransferase class III-fold pyridoxal phosphate-dependent enzyme, partial [Acidimicrobiia bacterium]|nr:aminotransferase class III-fold pyridoxal phosphate-dependent enzyme [Acidimicrobiia bacterium]